MALKEQLKQYAYELGADLVGFGNVERCEHAPLMMSPQGLFPKSRTVLVMAIHHPDASVELGGEDHPQEISPYSVQYLMNSRLDEMSYRMATFLEKQGYGAVPIVSSNIWRYNRYKELDAVFAPDVSHIYMAVVAGLSEIGYNGISLTPEYGPRNRFITVITDAEVEPDSLIPPGTVCDSCLLCKKECPAAAFDKEVDGEKVLKIENYEYRFPNKNLWRCAWGEHFDLDLDLEIPDVVDEKVILETIAEHGIRSGEMGQCLKFCVPGNKRIWDKAYSRTPVRKLTTTFDESLESRADIDRILMQAYNKGGEYIIVQKREELERAGIDIQRHLPGAESAVTVVIRQPAVTSDSSDAIFQYGAQYLADSICYDVTRDLENMGFRSVMTIQQSASHPDPMTAENLTSAIVATIPELADDPSVLPANTVITRKRIATRIPSFHAGTRTIAAGRNTTAGTPAEKLTAILRQSAIDLGADLVGVASVQRLNDIADQIRSSFDGQKSFLAHDRSKRFYPWAPEIETVTRTVKVPSDYLPTAKSVIVFALRYHEEVLKHATRAPAEAVGPYSFQTYVTHWLGSVIGAQMVKRIEEFGYNAAVSMDLLNTASVTASPRGSQPDSFSNRFAAVASGLASLAVNGRSVTPEFGQRQRFIAIITDAELTADPIRESHKMLCEDCTKMCISTCPSHAISDTQVTFTCDEAEFGFHKIDNNLCDWVKRYVLQGESGFKYLGSDTDIDPEGFVTEEKLVDALRQLDPIKKFRPVVAEPCLINCPYGNTAINIDGVYTLANQSQD